MKHFALIIFTICALCAVCQDDHEFLGFVGCFEDDKTELQFQFDEEEMSYIDLQREEIFYTVPKFIDINPNKYVNTSRLLREALHNRKMCVALIKWVKLGEEFPHEEQDPPDSMIFPTREVEAGEENRLICFVNNFFPPSINLTWTKNNHPVSEGVSFTQYLPNNDQTFRQFSTLTFTPREGDVYSCTVEHPALETPQTKIWEVELMMLDQSFGADVFCGAGLVLGLLGITVGVYFLVLGHGN